MKPNNSMRMAVVQFYTDANVEKNWERAIAYLKEAAAEKVDLIVFPEHFLSSALDGPTDPMDRICALARKYGVDIVAGTYGERDPSDGLVFNTCNYVDKYGQILMSYRKVHLWQVEGKHYKPGSEFCTVTNRFGVKVGLGACFDLSFHDGFAEMALNQGAELIVIPSTWVLENCGWTGMKYNPKSQVLKLDAYCAARAFEYGVVLVFANGAASPRSIPKPPTKPYRFQDQRYGFVGGFGDLGGTHTDRRTVQREFAKVQSLL